MDEAELKTMLTQLGQVASVKLLTRKETGKRKGFGFIEMPAYDQAKAAIAALNGKEIYGRNIALSEGLEKQQEVERPAFEQRPRREFSGRNERNHNGEKIDGNRWQLSTWSGLTIQIRDKIKIP